MITLSKSLVEEVWLELLACEPEQVTDWVRRFRLAQPELAGYVRAAEDSALALADRGSLMLYAVWAWEVCRRAGAARRAIDGDFIEAALAENEKLLQAVEHAPANDVMSTAAAWTEHYPPLPLLSAILHQTMAGELEETRRVDDFLGIITLLMKTVIDCLAVD